MVNIKKFGTWVLERALGKLAPYEHRVPYDIPKRVLGVRAEYGLFAAHRGLAYLMIQPGEFYYKLEHRRQEPVRESAGRWKLVL